MRRRDSLASAGAAALGAGALDALGAPDGAHLYPGPGAVTHAGTGTVVLHTKHGGPRTVRPRNGRSVSLDLAPNSTVLLDAESGELLIP